jgi:hypothetical protein
LKAAIIVANVYFKSDVVFLHQATYATLDIFVRGVAWEIKSPLGGGRKTIENNMRTARKQLKNLIIDFSRMKLHQSKAIANIQFYLKHAPGQFTSLIVITKDGKILEIV